MKHLKRTLFGTAIAAAAVLSVGAPSLVQAQGWPNKPVRIVVAYPPGGATDTQARIVAQRLSEKWKQSVIVENKPGGNTVIATEAVLKSAPDGHTLLLTAMPFVLNTYLMSNLPYDPFKDFSPVTVVTRIPNILVASQELGVKNLKELTAKAKAAPGTISFASTGTATSTHLSGELYASMAGVQLLHVPYKGSAAAHQDLLTGRVNIMFDNGILQHVKAGRVVPLAVTSTSRLPWLPDVPTMAEQGLAGYDVAAWYGIFVPSATPKEVTQRIAADITEIVRSPDLQAKWESMGAIAGGGTPEETTKFLHQDAERWSKLIKERDIKL
ncbi:MAG: tripartite tricarboxylate transporter substrate binding protein [Burkholderiales bacterium]|nr:tripartite tricarboxylate transporter substrate binding protein [Burkholderiales bacterium]